MPVLNIDGRRVTVDDSFMSLSPEDQSATVDEIAASFAPAPAQADAPAGDPGAEFMSEPPPGMEMDPVTGQMFDPALRQATIDRHADSPVVGALKRTGAVADNAVRGAADTMTFGLADEMAAKAGDLTGIGGAAGGYDANLAEQRQRDSEGGAARLAGQLAGAVALPAVGARTVLGAAAQGAGMGAAYGFGTGEGGVVERAKSAGIGAVTGGIAGGAVQGVANSLGRSVAKASIPTNEQLKASAQVAYQAADDAGIIFKPRAILNLGMKARSDLTEFGYHPNLQPRIKTVLDEMVRLSSGNVTLKGVDTLRKMASAAGQSTDASERALASKIIGRIDDFVQKAGPDDVLTGNAEVGQTALKTARDLWSRLKKSETLDTRVASAELRAASTGSGGNVDNAIRQNVGKMLTTPKIARGMSDTEKKLAERVARGTTAQNGARLLGKLAPGGNGLMTALGAGGAYAMPTLAIPGMIAGTIAKKIADGSTGRNVAALSEAIRSGGKTATQIALEAAQGRGDQKTVELIQKYLARSAAIRSPLATGAAAAGTAVADQIMR